MIYKAKQVDTDKALAYIYSCRTQIYQRGSDEYKMNLEWNVFYYDFNTKEIKVSNVFNHWKYKEEVEDLLHKCADRNDFSDKLKSVTMYYFWCKCEWETVVYPWVGDDKAAKKIDVFWQLQNNWDRFVEYLWNVSKLEE